MTYCQVCNLPVNPHVRLLVFLSDVCSKHILLCKPTLPFYYLLNVDLVCTNISDSKDYDTLNTDHSTFRK